MSWIQFGLVIVVGIVIFALVKNIDKKVKKSGKMPTEVVVKAEDTSFKWVPTALVYLGVVTIVLGLLGCKDLPSGIPSLVIILFSIIIGLGLIALSILVKAAIKYLDKK